MSVPDFLDTNILVYAYVRTDERKQQTAQNLMRKALEGESVISFQVLAEFVATLLQKPSPAARAEDMISILDALQPVRAITPDAGMVRRAVEARAQHAVHFSDGMILAAERAGCSRIWSEDLKCNPGILRDPGRECVSMRFLRGTTSGFIEARFSGSPGI